MVNNAIRKFPHLVYRWRGTIGFITFIFVWLISFPTLTTCFQGVPFILLGMVLRFWAVGFIGRSARSKFIDLSHIVRSGPYRFFPHPIYFGNFLLVSGMLIALHPPLWVFFLVLFGFLGMYRMIARTEERVIKESNLPVADKHFSFREGLWEWHTWVTTIIAYGFTLVKAFYFSFLR